MTASRGDFKKGVLGQLQKCSLVFLGSIQLICCYRFTLKSMFFLSPLLIVLLLIISATTRYSQLREIRHWLRQRNSSKSTEINFHSRKRQQRRHSHKLNQPLTWVRSFIRFTNLVQLPSGVCCREAEVVTSVGGRDVLVGKVVNHLKCRIRRKNLGPGSSVRKPKLNSGAIAETGKRLHSHKARSGMVRKN